jgi:glycosyltransferase involved in cell wall biosynthesis
MSASVDLAVVGQDPWLIGGYRTQAQAFWRAAADLGRDPHLFCIGHEGGVSLYRRTLRCAPTTALRDGFLGSRYPPVMPELPSLNHIANARRMSTALRSPRSLWVVTTSAHHGFPAVLSGRRYACWVGTGFADEDSARDPGLPVLRRFSARANAPAFRRLERAVLRNATLLFATSPASRRAAAAAAGVPLERVGLLPIAIDSDLFSAEADDAWRARMGDPVIVFVGRASDPRKNVALLVDAFAEIRRRMPRARLWLVGRPPSRTVLRRLPDGAAVLGEVQSVPPVLRYATLFVLPSRQEGFGVAVAEALACGVPAIVTPSGGPEDMIRESGAGRVLTGFTKEELVEEAVDVLSDPIRLMTMRRSGRAYVAREHSPRRLTCLLEAAFARLDDG